MNFTSTDGSIGDDTLDEMSDALCYGKFFRKSKVLGQKIETFNTKMNILGQNQGVRLKFEDFRPKIENFRKNIKNFSLKLRG